MLYPAGGGRRGSILAYRCAGRPAAGGAHLLFQNPGHLLHEPAVLPDYSDVLPLRLQVRQRLYAPGAGAALCAQALRRAQHCRPAGAGRHQNQYCHHWGRSRRCEPGRGAPEQRRFVLRPPLLCGHQQRQGGAHRPGHSSAPGGRGHPQPAAAAGGAGGGLCPAHTYDEQKKLLYERYKAAGYKIKVYDFPTMQSAGGRRHLREFDIEELLFRKPVVVNDERTRSYYHDKVILITGGGGSIGSELCRQLAKMEPRQLILLDIYENGVYDVQQELRIAYAGALDVQVEILSVTNKLSLEKVFQTYRPQIVIHAAAHKHVPLMEHNCVEAVWNNVFGTAHVIELCEQYEAERFMMVSTDKAVNPTNVMGATKRMCEILVQCASTYGKVKYSATRFGNVLGSAGSVIPLFKKQIANGGPVTITDKRIIRYFMTIPEASQLVLASGAMAKNGELFVLDMGQPVRILDLAENMIRLSGVHGVEIVETGLRPGEKLYEELLIKTENLDKTDNSLIFIERDLPHTKEEIDEKLQILHRACATEDDDIVRAALHQVVPTFHKPEDVNRDAEQAAEMLNQKKTATA